MQQTTTISVSGTASHRGDATGDSAMSTATTAHTAATGTATAGQTHTGQATATQAAPPSTSFRRCQP
ncbi:hypothetical protein AB0B28_05160 [Glycomyces sp. NPDC046736]|uniref:hypothetical protein n=1 Tax=Glycomyces sp. NPDC046736 TaxID=3155615 RepID=UPI0033FF9824